MSAGAVPTPPEEATQNARRYAYLAESLDSGGMARERERNAAMAFANMWSLLAIAETIKEMTTNGTHGQV